MDSPRDEWLTEDDRLAILAEASREGLGTPGESLGGQVMWRECQEPLAETRLRFNSLVPVRIHELELTWTESGEGDPSIRTLRLEATFWPLEGVWEVESL